MNPVGLVIGISTCRNEINRITNALHEKIPRDRALFQETLTSRLTAKAGQWRPMTSNHTDLDCNNRRTDQEEMKQRKSM